LKPRIVYLEACDIKCYLALIDGIDYDDLTSVAMLQFSGRVDVSLYPTTTVGEKSAGISQVLTPTSRTMGMKTGTAGVLRIPYSECMQFMEIDESSDLYKEILSCM